mmetsp:Transcript_9855/g.39960  ORF Transcript_9855/g.39960 Transcript_9855/m.39960 type:complete len:272 (+) Transcript_9855:80-895(+)
MEAGAVDELGDLTQVGGDMSQPPQPQSHVDVQTEMHTDLSFLPPVDLQGEQKMDSRMAAMLCVLAQHHSKAQSRREKHRILAMVLEAKRKYKHETGKKLCSMRELREAGFALSNTQVKTVKNWMETEEYVRLVHPEQDTGNLRKAARLGKPPSPHIEVIRRFYYNDDISHPAMGRTVRVGNQVLTGRFLYKPLSKTYQIYSQQEDLPSVSLSTFRKYKPPEILWPHADSDPCSLCATRKATEVHLPTHTVAIVPPIPPHREGPPELNIHHE